MKTITVSYEDLSKTMAVSVFGVFSLYNIKYTKAEVRGAKEAFQMDLEKSNSIDKSVKQYNEEIDNEQRKAL